MSLRNLVQVVPVILVFIIIAGMFSVLLIPVNIEIYGTVTDNEGNPLYHVYMYVYSSDDINVAEGGVDTQGHFSLFVHHYGEYEVWATMQSGYWAQFQKVKFESPDKNIRQEMDFQLARNVPIGNIPLVAMYWSVNSSHTSISFGYNVIGKIYTAVHRPNSSLDNGGGFYYDGGVAPGHSTSGTSHQGMSGYVLSTPGGVSGEYSTTPGKFEDCWVTGEAGGYLGLPSTDYLAVYGLEGGRIEIINANESREVMMFPSGNYTLPEVFSLHFSVNILGTNASGEFQCAMLDTVDSYHSVWIDITNLDNVPHTYETYFEGGHILHVWEIQ
jgi:hypothetical protein